MVNRAGKAQPLTLRIGNSNLSHRQHSDAGFTLVEILSVLVIIGLLSSLVVFNMPPSKTESEKQAEQLVRELNALSQQALISGEIRAFGLSETNYSLFRYDGSQFTPLTSGEWVDDFRPSLTREETKLKLTEEVTPLILFEPTSINTPFTLTLSGSQYNYDLTSEGDGKVALVKTR